MAKHTSNLTFSQQVAKIKHAGISGSKMIAMENVEWADLNSLEERLKSILGIVRNVKRRSTDMLFFVMYDIESNKVRRLVHKYLLKNGCFRVQRSIFLADLSSEKYEQIRLDLAEVQSFYDNKDSILIVPVSTELIKSMKIIGKNIDIDIIMRSKNTLFF